MPAKNTTTAKQYFLKLKHMDSKTEDSLTRFYLRLLKSGSWSYQLRKENLLLKRQSQEAYRKKLNKFTKQGFLTKGKKYMVDGKPRIPFEANTEMIKSIVERYAITPVESKAAMLTFNDLKTQDDWIQTLNEKLESEERLKLMNTLFPIVFMGHEISKFFFRLLVISVTRSTPEFKKNNQYDDMHKMLVNVLNTIQLSIAHDGADYIGKRLFLDYYVKDVMTLLYATGANEKHWDTMKIAILEDVTIPLLTPVSYPFASRDSNEFNALKPQDRFEMIINHIKKSEDHFVKDYYGDDWESGLALYIYYALTTSLQKPSREIKDFIQYLSTEHNLTKKAVKKVEQELNNKLERHKNEKATILL